MTNIFRKTATPDRPGSALEVYTSTLTTQRESAESAHAESVEMWGLIEGWAIGNAEDYNECGALLKEVKGKHKFLDDERKVSVTPLNDEVKRVNDWYRPALEQLKRIADHATKLMGTYVLQQRQEEQRLLQEAAAAAQAVLATSPDIRESMEGTVALVAQAAASAAPVIENISHRPVWTFTITNPAALVRAHPELAMPDMKLVAAWVKEHGDKNVPTGVEVRSDVRFRTTS